MLYVGIDPGVQNIGISVLSHKGELLDTEYLKVKQPESIGYIDIIDDFCYLLAKWKSINKDYEVKISIEKPFFTIQTLAKNIRTLEVIGLIKYALYLRHSLTEGDISMYSPATIKKAMTGNGRADKKEVIASVIKHFNIKNVQNNHIADAVAIAYTDYIQQTTMAI